MNLFAEEPLFPNRGFPGRDDMVILYDIRWDLEGMTVQECDLPESVLVLHVQNDLRKFLEFGTIYVDLLGIKLSEAFGFQHSGFSWQVPSEFEGTHPAGLMLPRMAIMVSPRPQKCSRTACDSPAHPLLVHSQLKQPYCVKCARRINEAGDHPNLIPWPTPCPEPSPKPSTPSAS